MAIKKISAWHHWKKKEAASRPGDLLKNMDSHNPRKPYDRSKDGTVSLIYSWAVRACSKAEE